MFKHGTTLQKKQIDTTNLELRTKTELVMNYKIMETRNFLSFAGGAGYGPEGPRFRLLSGLKWPVVAFSGPAWLMKSPEVA